MIHEDIVVKLTLMKTLSSREIEVVKLVAKGMTNKEIGQALFISEGTVKHHLSSIFSKLDVDNRVKVAAYAIKVGLGSPTV